jgi:hypothetical protein
LIGRSKSVNSSYNISLDMREIRLEVVPKPEPGTAATIYEKSEQIGD